LLLIAPQLVYSALAPQRTDLTFATWAVSLSFRQIGFVALIFLFLSRNREAPDEIGWTFKKGARSIVFATLTFPLIFYGLAIGLGLLQGLGLSIATQPRSYLILHSPTELPLLGFLSVVNGTAEEIIFRGYLLLRLTSLMGRTWAVLLSSVIFGIEHLYQGTANAVAAGCFGVVLALVCLQMRSLVIPSVWHCLQDFVAILLASSIR
jgi:membrane protease YdiL (CAAX protease family)